MKRDQPLRSGIRQCAQQDAVRQTEDPRCQSYPERESRAHDGGPSRRLPKHPQPVPRILPNFFKPSHASIVTTLFFCLLDSAENLASRIARLFRAHPKTDILLGLSLDVIAQLIVQFALHL